MGDSPCTIQCSANRHEQIHHQLSNASKARLLKHRSVPSKAPTPKAPTPQRPATPQKPATPPPVPASKKVPGRKPEAVFDSETRVYRCPLCPGYYPAEDRMAYHLSCHGADNK